MFKKIIEYIWKPESLQNLETPQDENFVFDLLYKQNFIGKLELLKGNWEFEYSEDFRNQNKLTTLIDFPNKDKKYSSNKLWPFFISRIPSSERPEIKEYIIEKKIDENNEAELLKYFGQKSITNPFILKPTDSLTKK